MSEYLETAPTGAAESERRSEHYYSAILQAIDTALENADQHTNVEELRTERETVVRQLGNRARLGADAGEWVA